MQIKTSFVKIVSIALFVSLFPLVASAIDTPRAEYPRPQFERGDWVNLNGTWDYTFDFADTGIERGLQKADSYDGKIIVPFCPESELSGVGHKDFINCIWYRRDLPIPSDWTGKDILLNFGAVYYDADIFIDGNLIDRHFGGSSSFTVDLTPYVKPGQTHNLVVRATSDVRSGHQSAGKQSLQSASNGCNYTRTTGIWQTVWMEAVDPGALQNVRTVTDIDQEQLVVEPVFYNVVPGNILEITVIDPENNKTVSTRKVPANNNTVAIVPMKKARLWSPESPNLYTVNYKVLTPSGEVVDEVSSYVGMRKIHVEGNKVYLNNEPYYQRLVLDQGFYPDGIWTAPSDDALRNDIQLSKSVGFNGARLHQKVFEERYYYWADKLGYLTWGEAPSWGMDMNSVEAARNFNNEWREIITRDRNHPSLVTWTPMNEQFWPDHINYPRLVKDIYDMTRTIDPTRPINDVSGGSHIKTDLWTVHHYEQDPDKLKEIIYNDGKMFDQPLYLVNSVAPGANIGYNFHAAPLNYPYPHYDGSIPFIVDEVGGIKWVKDQDKESRPDSWGYGASVRNEEEFFKRLEGQINALLDLESSVWGYCYTQLTDVEQEQNGVFYYDRSPKFDAERFRAIFSKNPDSMVKKSK